MDLIIIAAGNGSRLKSLGVPKAIMPINGVPNLINTVKSVGDSFDNIYIVISSSSEDKFNECLDEHCGTEDWDHITLIDLDEARGSGAGVMEGLQKIYSDTHITDHTEAIILWGDTYINDARIFSEIMAKGYDDSPILIPVKLELKPYLSLEVDPGTFKCTKADFTQPEHGYHDQSIFRIRVKEMINVMESIHYVIWDQDHYTTDVGEYSFMIIIQYLHNIGTQAQAYITSYTTEGYNTLAEIRKIENR